MSRPPWRSDGFNFYDRDAYGRDVDATAPRPVPSPSKSARPWERLAIALTFIAAACHLPGAYRGLRPQPPEHVVVHKIVEQAPVAPTPTIPPKAKPAPVKVVDSHHTRQSAP